MSVRHLVVVPHTHWDREWYVPFESFRKRLVSMVDRLLETLENDRTFKHFELDGQTIILSDYLAIRPENEKRLRRLIEQGRIIIGAWYVQPDEFLVTGEAIIRNLRMGIRSAKKFGKPSMIGYMPDQFGHISQMPQILSGFGMRSAVVWRGVGETVDRTQFLWESPDGTRLFTIYLADSYGNGAYMPLKAAALKKRLRDLIKRQEAYCDIDSMLIMNGLDHLGAQDGLPEQLEKAARGLRGVTLEMGSLRIFIEQARRQARSLPVHRGEFRSPKRAPLLPGVTSARLRQKQRDFKNCRLLEKYVEPLCAWALLCGDKRPHRSFIEHAWRLTLENHPHDSICGCSVDAVHNEMETRFDRAGQIAQSLFDDAFSFLSGRVDSSWTHPESPALCVFNPTSLDGQVVDVETDLEEPDFVGSLKDSRGRIIPLQKTVGKRELFIGVQLPPETVREQLAGMEGRELMGFYINNMLWQRDGKVLKLVLIMGRAPIGEVDLEGRRKELLDALGDPSVEIVDVKGISGAKTRLIFHADDLPPVGLGVFSLCREAADAGAKLSVSDRAIENDFYMVTVDADGALNILDKESGVEFRGCLRYVDEGDRGDSYNFDKTPGGEIISVGAGADNVSVVEDGPVRGTLKLKTCLRIPDKLTPTRDARSSVSVPTTVTTHVSLYAYIKRIDFRTAFDNQCEDHRLRVVFNAPFAAPDIVVESTFDIVRRPATVEPCEGRSEMPVGTSPQKTFSCIENGRIGMALFNRGIPEIEAAAGKDATALALTLLRSVGWLAREDLGSRPVAAGPTLEAPGAQSKGAHEFEYAFTSYKGGYTEADIVRQAHAYAFPPVAITTNRHSGRIKTGSSLISADDPAVVASAVEPSRLRRACLVRLYNASDRALKARLAFWGGRAKIYEVNMLEKRRSGKPIRRKAGRVELVFRPAEIKTLQVVTE